MISEAVLLLAGLTSTATACALLGKPRASHYRDRCAVPLVPAQRQPRPAPSNALTPAERGVLLRREGLYSSHLSEWRKARNSGALSGLAPAARAGTTSAQDKENSKLKARAERAERELAKTKAALEIVGKAHALLEMLSESADTEPRSKP